MSDRQLLEDAAKAAGMAEELEWWDGGFIKKTANQYAMTRWNPLTDDGDALRLAVKLALFWNPLFSHFLAYETFFGDDKDYASVRRAIVHAAAELGKSKP